MHIATSIRLPPLVSLSLSILEEKQILKAERNIKRDMHEFLSNQKFILPLVVIKEPNNGCWNYFICSRGNLYVDAALRVSISYFPKICKTYIHMYITCVTIKQCIDTS